MEKAVRIAGGQSELARILGVTREAVRQWVVSGRCSYLRVLDVEKATKVPRHILRPDLYPKPSAR